MNYTVIIDVDVDDEQQLFDAARKHAIEVDGITPEHADAKLKPGGEIRAGDCLIMLLDPGTLPGCSINQSTYE